MQHVTKEALRGSVAITRKGEDDDPIGLVSKSLEELQKTVDERLKKVESVEPVDTKALTERLDKLEAKANRPAGKTDPEETKEIEKKALNTFLRSGAAALDDVERKTLNIGTATAGGYVTAPEYSTQIIESLVEWSPMRRVASSMNIGTEKVYIPLLDSRLSGSWVTETGERQSSEPTFDQMEISVYEHAVIVPISQQLLEDSFIDLQSYLSGQIGQMFGKAEATAFLTGDGSGKPTGLLATPTDYSAVEANQDGSDILAKVIEAFYALPSAYASRGSWMMNRATQGIIRAAADGTTSGNLWSDSLANGQPATLLGRPVYDAPDMDDLADGEGAATYPIAFGDFASAYRIVDRVGIQIMRDDYTGADNGIVKIRARRRVGGKPLLTEAIGLISGAAA